MSDVVGVDPKYLKEMIDFLDFNANELQLAGSRLQTSFAHVGLSESGVQDIIAIGKWAQEQLPYLKRVWSLAMQLDKDPGQQGIVEIPEGLLKRSPEEARREGERLANEYKDAIDNPQADPNRIVELAKKLDQYWHDPDLAAGFVNTAGADRMTRLVRIIQGMENVHKMMGTSGVQGPFEIRGLYHDFKGNFAEDLLRPIAETMGAATYSEQLDPKVRDGIRHHQDAWAMSQLLRYGRYHAQFLTDAFESGVVNRLETEYQDTKGWLGIRQEILGIGGPTALDPMDTIMAAIGRNEEAAVRISERLDDKIVLDPRNLQNMRKEVELGHYLLNEAALGDGGHGFGQMLITATQGLHNRGEGFTANEITRRLAENAIHGQRKLDGAMLALAENLARHNMDDLHRLARSPLDPKNFTTLQAGTDRIEIPPQPLKDMLTELARHGKAHDHLLAGIVKYQAAQFDQHRTPHDKDTEWAREIGAFDGLLHDTTSAANIGAAKEADERRERVVNALSAAGGLIPISGRPLVERGLDEIRSLIAEEVKRGDVEDQARKKVDTTGEVKKKIFERTLAIHYYNNDAFDPATKAELQQRADAAVTNTANSFRRNKKDYQFMKDGKIIPYNEMTREKQQAFDEWRAGPPEDRNHTVIEAIKLARQEYSDAFQDYQPPA